MLPQVEKGLQFLREVRVEARKVTWPTTREATGATWVVVGMVAFISLFLFVVDFFLSRFINYAVR